MAKVSTRATTLGLSGTPRTQWPAATGRVPVDAGKIIIQGRIGDVLPQGIVYGRI